MKQIGNCHNANMTGLIINRNNYLTAAEGYYSIQGSNTIQKKESKMIHFLLIVPVITDVENVTLNFPVFAAISIRVVCVYLLQLLYDHISIAFFTFSFHGCKMIGCRSTILAWRKRDTASPHLSVSGANPS